MMKRAVFLDKDGTLVENVPYNVDLHRIQLTPLAGKALALMSSGGFELYVISNQSGIARGIFQESDLVPVWDRIQELLQCDHVSIQKFYYCPHDPGGTVSKYSVTCSCKKPSPGLILKAAQEHSVLLHQSWFIGDILDDIEAGHRAGCQTVMIDNGNETQWKRNPLRTPDFIVSDLYEAAKKIITDAARMPIFL